jgi:hypothetical protein
MTIVVTAIFLFGLFMVLLNLSMPPAAKQQNINDYYERLCRKAGRG